MAYGHQAKCRYCRKCFDEGKTLVLRSECPHDHEGAGSGAAGQQQLLMGNAPLEEQQVRNLVPSFLTEAEMNVSVELAGFQEIIPTQSKEMLRSQTLKGFTVCYAARYDVPAECNFQDKCL